MLKPKFLPILAAAVGALVLASGPATADAIYSFTTGSNGNANQAGTALFDFTDANNFTITLTNTGDITAISSIFDGISFTKSGTVTGITLNSISTTEGQVDCSTGTCVDSNPGTQPVTDWVAANTGSNITLDAGGTGTFKPFGVVNDTIDSACDTAHDCMMGGLSNDQHNPYLEGPVVFSLTTTGETSIPTLSTVVGQFGTTPDNITLTPVPAPPIGHGLPLLLAVGGMLFGAKFWGRRKKASASFA